MTLASACSALDALLDASSKLRSLQMHMQSLESQEGAMLIREISSIEQLERLETEEALRPFESALAAASAAADSFAEDP